MSRHHSLRTRVAATAAAIAVTGAGIVGLSTATAGEATADRHPLPGCIGLSPNIVDLPFWPETVDVAQYTGKTYISVDFTSYWLFVGYRSDARLDWHNPGAKKRGVLFSSTQVQSPYVGVHWFVIPTNAIGRGNVNVTLSATNSNALWSIPSIPCSGTIVVR
ncbi:hypothetical protein VZC37_06480 [Gordonia sp. LSe1-13]|uniref:Secreted protein n=1 Tax=Gordonia sesuvii TaxID=3116777 RepID=A0ABU7MA73_9ACTN|nr:hypothetical protein [Gordonia sp. LSe1-13]